MYIYIYSHIYIYIHTLYIHITMIYHFPHPQILKAQCEHPHFTPPRPWHRPVVIWETSNKRRPRVPREADRWLRCCEGKALRLKNLCHSRLFPAIPNCYLYLFVCVAASSGGSPGSKFERPPGGLESPQVLLERSVRIMELKFGLGTPGLAARQTLRFGGYLTRDGGCRYFHS